MKTPLVLALAAALAGCATKSTPLAATCGPAEPAHMVTVTTQGARLSLRPGSTPRLQRVAAFSGDGGAVLSCKPARGGLKGCVVLYEDMPGRGYGAAARAYAARVVYPSDEDAPTVEVRVRFTPRPQAGARCS